MKTENSRGRYRKKKKNPQAVRNQRVLIFTFVIILALMFQSNRWQLQKERLMEKAGEVVAIATGDGAGDAVGGDGDVVDGAGDAAGGDKMAADQSAGGTDEGQAVSGKDGMTDADKAVGAEDVGAAADGNQAMDEGDLLAAELKRAEAGLTGQAEAGVTEQAESGEELILREEDMWCLILTNARYPVPDDYEVDLAKLPGSSQSVDARIYEPLMSMFEAMKAEGMSPVVCSGYRTLDKQEKLFNRKVQTYVRQGNSMEEANAKARQVLSIPGSGEHCLGLAVDIYASSYKKLEIGFENRPEGKWLREHAQDYGFVLRYDKGKEEVTGIQYEPWHFRYVGVEVAQYLKKHQLTLEEFYIEQSLYG